MKSVWIIWDDGDFDTGPTVSAIYETQELANKCLVDLKAKPRGFFYYVEEWKLNTVAP